MLTNDKDSEKIGNFVASVIYGINDVSEKCCVINRSVGMTEI